MPPGKEVQVPKLSEVRSLDHLAFDGNSSWTIGNLPLLNNRDVHDLDGELQQWNLHRFLHGQDRGHLSSHNKRAYAQQPYPKTTPVESPRGFKLHLYNIHGTSWAPVVAQQRERHQNLVQDLQKWHLHKLLRSQDHGQLSLHNNGHVNNLSLHNSRHASNHVQELQLWNIHKLTHNLPLWVPVCLEIGTVAVGKSVGAVVLVVTGDA